MILPQDKDCGGRIFATLKKIVDFDYAQITCDDVEYTYGKPVKGAALTEELKIKNATFGQIVIARKKDFTPDEQVIFKTCAGVISGIIKDIEINKIINMQVCALQKGMQQVVEAQRVKSDFLANISHELRTPLNAIIGFSDLLGQDFVGTLNDKQKEYLNDIRVAGLHLLGMINGVLDISKIEAGAMKLSPSEFRLKQAVDEVLNILDPLARKKNIKMASDVRDAQICADYQKLQQILFNLISNAIKFSHTNGEVKISAHADKKQALISVADSGIGIEKKHHKKIFKKFEQIKTMSNSTGLGLAITKEFVKLHRGTIAVDSELGKGTTFTVTLPIA
jgi:signal transduction histidine kinase